MGSRARILVVDDEPDLGALWQIILTADGHAVDLAIGGQAALAHLAAGAAYDLVVCDLHMPGVDGVGVYRAIGPLAPTGPAVQFMACCAGSARYEGFLRTTGAPVLPKPFHLDELREAVRRALGRRPAENRRASPARAGPSSFGERHRCC